MAQTPEKDLEIQGVAGMHMRTICMLKLEDTKMKSHGTKILVLIMMILGTKHMEADQEAKVREPPWEDINKISTCSDVSQVLEPTKWPNRVVLALMNNHNLRSNGPPFVYVRQTQKVCPKVPLLNYLQNLTIRCVPWA